MKQSAKKMTKRSTSKYDLEERLLDFGAACIGLCDKLESSRATSHVSNQLIRSSTSPMSNHGEAQAAKSNADFRHKMSICLKELRESKRWLQLVNRVPMVKSSVPVDDLIEECEELIKIFFTSIRTSKSKTRDNLKVEC